MQNTDKYDLTKEEYERCLGMAELAIFMRGQSMTNPKSIFIIAQAGARKDWIKKLCY